jgi:hypothetical protein
MLIVGGLALLSAAAMAGAAGPDGTGMLGGGGMVANACLVLLGSGAGVLSVFGPRPLDGWGTRLGLGALAIGLSGFLVATNTSIPAGTNDLESGPFVIGSLVGALGMVLGSLVTGLSLVRIPGPTRVVGVLLLAGLGLLGIGSVSILGIVGLVLGSVGIAVLAITGGASRPSGETSNRQAPL